MAEFKRADSPYYYWKLVYKGEIYQGSTGTKNRAEAKLIFEQNEKAIKQNRFIYLDKTYGELVDHYIDSYHPNEQATLRWTLRFWKNKKLTELTTVEIKRVQEVALTLKKASSVNRMFNTVRSILNRAMRSLGWLESVPVWKKEKESEPIRKILKREDEPKLMAELPPHLQRIVEFALETGLRKTMIVSLTMEMFDKKRGTLKIPAHLNMKTGKSFEPRISKPAVELILQEEGTTNGQLGLRIANPKRPIFTYKGKAIKNPAGAAWRKAVARAKLDITFHSLRHTWTTRKLEEGMPEAWIVALGGWTSSKMLKVYSHPNAMNFKGLERFNY